MVLRFHRMISGIKGHCSKGCFKKVGKFSFNTCPCGINNECLIMFNNDSCICLFIATVVVQKTLGGNDLL